MDHQCFAYSRPTLALSTYEEQFSRFAAELLSLMLCLYGVYDRDSATSSRTYLVQDVTACHILPWNR